MLHIVTLNLNGIRSACKKGLCAWVAKNAPDILAFQELKAQQEDLSPEMAAPENYHAFYAFAEKKGYSGVGLWCRKKPLQVITEMGNAEFDAEGRYIRADFPDYTVISVYLPSGSSSPERQLAKFRFMDCFFPHLRDLIGQGREFVICGDWNIAHQEIDLKNWKGNLKNSGFLPEERGWLSQVLDELGWVDTYRRLYPDTGEAAYTWWSNRGAAWAKNVGWRIDYQIATPAFAALAKEGHVYKEERFSDHAPLMMQYSL